MAFEQNAAQFTKFLALGGIAAGVNVGSRIVFSLFSPFSVAVVLAYATGLITAFCLFRLFVFPPATKRNSMLLQLWRFTLVNLIALPQVFLVSMLMLELLKHSSAGPHAEIIAHVIGVSVPVFTSFLGHKYFSFAGRST